MFRSLHKKANERRSTRNRCRSMTKVGGDWPVHNSLITSCPVPIYDARREKRFAFHLNDLRDVGKLPRFKGGNKDPLPHKYVATIGYTVGTFVYNGSNTVISGRLAVAMNVMFVIILGRSVVTEM
jgi:hypothetical protein